MLTRRICTTSSTFLLPVYHKRSYTFSIEQDRRSKQAISLEWLAVQVSLVEIVSNAKYLVRVFSIFVIESVVAAGGTCTYHRKQVAFDRGGY